MSSDSSTQHFGTYVTTLRIHHKAANKAAAETHGRDMVLVVCNSSSCVRSGIVAALEVVTPAASDKSNPSEPTICAKCQHVRPPHDPEPSLAMSTCAANPIEDGGGLNWVTGVIRQPTYVNCRDINDGSCEQFVPKK